MDRVHHKWINSSDLMPAYFVLSSDDLLRSVCESGRTVLALADGADVSWSQETPVCLMAGGRLQGRVSLLGRSNATVICRGRAFLRMTIRSSGSTRILAGGRCQLRVTTIGSAAPVVCTSDEATLLVVAQECSAPYVQALDSSMMTLVVYDRAQPRCSSWPDGWLARPSDIYIGQRLVCFESEAEAVAAAVRLYREWLDCRNRFMACMRVSGAVPRVCPDVVDFRWTGGTVHLELPGELNPRAWYSTNAHHAEPLTEEQRQRANRQYLD